MTRVNGLYGHIRRNNAKAAILIATFVALFLVTQFSFRMLIFWPMAQAEANGEVVPAVRDSDPISWRLLGFRAAETDQDFKHRVSVLKGEEAATEEDAERWHSAVRTGPRKTASLLEAIRLMATCTQYLGQQIIMEGFEAYIKKHPLLYVPFIAVAALVLPYMPSIARYLGFP